MLNQAVIVGRIVREPDVKKTENGKAVSNITLAVPREFKNPKGEYDTDFINCVLWKGVAESTATYCKKGDLIGVKGRIQSREYTNGEDEKKHIIEVVAEKVTFLSSKKQEEAE